jgi:hypothetical protein
MPAKMDTSLALTRALRTRGRVKTRTSRKAGGGRNYFQITGDTTIRMSSTFSRESNDLVGAYTMRFHNKQALREYLQNHREDLVPLSGVVR